MAEKDLWRIQIYNVEGLSTVFFGDYLHIMYCALYSWNIVNTPMCVKMNCVYYLSLNMDSEAQHVDIMEVNE